ncbi:putative E3 ubiquitin-protein ligase HERC3 [Folsomia candida]|uniref:Putative E3 ubiquitin-protein ligase HERC3 n=1 Tax=Folsomia candida TaxID=158441 RepID=A0A226EQ27_FOLCA|nr:putative E3 ubiquitin-protein ligase HERC3 [Folsomia candida]
MKEKTYCCGCCPASNSGNKTSSVKSNNGQATNREQQQNVIQMQPLPIQNQTNLETQQIYYWEGFRSKGEEIRPETLKISVPTQIKQISATETELLFLLEDGSLWSFDKTDGIRLSSSTIKPTDQGFSKSLKIEYIACGKYHSLALDINGNLYSWGFNHFGQLGLSLSHEDCEVVKYPQLVKSMASKVVIQIAAGENHSVALTENGSLYCCGSNSSQQLGISESIRYSTIFMEIVAISGLPWGFIAAGGNQTFGLTIHNSVFGWGDQSKNQSGMTYNFEEEIPTSIGPSEAVVFDDGTLYIAPGKWHTVFIGKGESARVYGSNRFNQIGPSFNEGLVTQIATGDYHTVMVGNGNLYVYGPETNETEEDIDIPNQPAPIPITLPVSMYNVFASGNGTFVVPLTDAATQNNIRHDMAKRRQMFKLTNESLTSFLRLQPDDEFMDAGLEKRWLRLFQVSIWNASFSSCQKSGLAAAATPLGESYFGYKIDFVMAETFIQKIWSCRARKLHAIFVSYLDSLMDANSSVQCGARHEEICPAFSYIPLIIFNSPKINVNVDVAVDTPPLQNAFVRFLRDFLLQSYSPVNEPKYLKKFAAFLFKNENLKDNFTTNIITLIYHGYSFDQLQRLVTAYKKVVVSTITVFRDEGSSLDAALVAIQDCLKFLNSLAIDLNAEFSEWMQNKTFPIAPASSRQVYLCDFPFIFDGSAKAILLRCEQKLQMIGASILSRIIEPPELQGFVLVVHRERLLEDVLRQIFLFGPFDFKKPLRIHFAGEEGQDAGGVRKEFFLLLIRELLDFCADRGLLKLNDESHLVWFNEYNGSAEEVKFLMVFGVLAGLAIYNNTIIKLPFPAALYKKLLGESSDIEDLVELSPTEGNSLKQVLEYKNPDLEQVFSLTFEISKDELGVAKNKQLKPNGKNIPVTLENSQEFVELYVDNVFNKSVETAFTAFKNGFELVFNESFAIKLFDCEELKEIIIGNEDYDWGRLEVDCVYKGEFHKGHQTICFFWEIFHELDLELKKQFLLFLTGSDRVPISGMSGIKVQ